jgi:hypothetical protein
MANVLTAGNSSNGGTAISTDTSGTLNIVTGSGSGANAITIDASQNVTMAANLSVTGNTTITGTLSASGGVSGGIRSGTAVASTSGTSIDFTSLPTGIKRITVIFNGVSLSGTSNFLVQMGAGSIETTGYVSTAQSITGGVGGGNSSSTAGMIMPSGAATVTLSGHMILTLISSNLWISSHVAKQTTLASAFGGGDKTLSGTLDRVRITTVNGTDTFDAGSINIFYE